MPFFVLLCGWTHEIESAFSLRLAPLSGERDLLRWFEMNGVPA
jgi:hypothetical protein